MQLAWESYKGTLIQFVLQLTSVTNTNSKIAYKIKTFSTTSKAKVVKLHTTLQMFTHKLQINYYFYMLLLHMKMCKMFKSG